MTRTVSPPRGDIVDRNGKVLAKDSPLVKLVVDPALFISDWCLFGSKKCDSNKKNYLKKLERENKAISQIAKVAGISTRELQDLIRSHQSRRYKVLKDGVPPTEIKSMKNDRLKP